MMKKYPQIIESTLKQMELSPDYKERWIEELSDRVQVEAFSWRGHLPIKRFLEIFEGLKAGKRYIPKINGWDGYNGMYATTDIDGTPIVSWQYHGSSAIKFELDEVWWLIHVIFDGQDFDEDKNWRKRK